jgi:two-component system, NtrC family, response regulator AtoC
VHALSQRRESPFVAVNCGAISPSLIESELFGHEKGSFTGAHRQHKGYFEQAVKGTLFLDEITEMPLELQVKLLRVLETGMLTRIGGEQPVRADVRLLAATNQDPEKAVENGKLRQDLFYRLNVFRLFLPPLRERGSDVILLADYFLGQLNKNAKANKHFSPAAVEHLRAYSWPGNVRELKNVVQRAFIVAEEEIGPQALPPEIVGGQPRLGTGLYVPVGTSLADADRKLILATLERCGGEKKKAAAMLGISLKTLYNRLAAYAKEDEEAGVTPARAPQGGAESAR